MTRETQSPAVYVVDDDVSIQRHSWPGNIRELQNVIERWAIGDAEWLPVHAATTTPSSVDPEAGAEPRPQGTLNFRAHVEALERKLIQQTLLAVGGNQSEAARRLGLHRGSFVKLLKKYRPLAG